MRKYTNIFIIIMIFISPFYMQAKGTFHLNTSQNFSRSSPEKAAIKDANKDVDGCLWLGAGCLANIYGIAAAYVVVPSPKISRLIGKSPDYILIYSDTYRKTAKNIQVKKSTQGCLIFAALYLLMIYYPAFAGGY